MKAHFSMHGWWRTS
ncbi:trp operon leader peptide [Lelliottia nimipressuralis]